jgi:hypothetical protein
MLEDPPLEKMWTRNSGDDDVGVVRAALMAEICRMDGVDLMARVKK